MTVDKLTLYNIAMRSVGERKLASLTEDREARHICDDAWDEGNGTDPIVRTWLEQGHWNFAMRAVKSDADTDITPEFGYTYAHAKASDFVKLNMISADENFNYPLTDYEPEGIYIYSWETPIYLRFVSDGATWGRDYTRWPNAFTQWCGYDLGLKIAPKLLNETDQEKLEKKVKKLRIDARSKDAMEEPPRWPALSSWAQSRHGRTRSGRSGDRGNRGRLIG